MSVQIENLKNLVSITFYAKVGERHVKLDEAITATIRHGTSKDRDSHKVGAKTIVKDVLRWVVKTPDKTTSLGIGAKCEILPTLANAIEAWSPDDGKTIYPIMTQVLKQHSTGKPLTFYDRPKFSGDDHVTAKFVGQHSNTEREVTIIPVIDRTSAKRPKLAIHSSMAALTTRQKQIVDGNVATASALAKILSSAE